MKKVFLSLVAAAFLSLPVMAADNDTSTREERNYIVEGNKLYREDRFTDAEVAYRKALQENPYSDVGRFNLAAALLKQGASDEKTQQEALQLLNTLAREATDLSIAEKAFYNLGNLAFNQQQYQQSIEHYKNALRRDPSDDKARENLRLAQKRLEQQQNQDQNQDQNKDKNKDQQQDQNKDQQQNQDQQNKDQNQDQQNKDENKDQNQDQQPQQQDQQPQKQNPPQQQQGGMSQENAEKILKAMENEEAATRRRIQNAEKKKSNSSRKNIQNPW